MDEGVSYSQAWKVRFEGVPSLPDAAPQERRLISHLQKSLPLSRPLRLPLLSSLVLASPAFISISTLADYIWSSYESPGFPSP